MRIGILGVEHVSATLGKAWVKVGHEVTVGVRHVTAPKIQALLADTGDRPRKSCPRTRLTRSPHS